MIIVWFAIAAAVGAVGRYAISASLPGNTGTALATLYINVGGSFVLGLLTGRSANTWTIGGIGALGAFTTFSTFALVTVNYIDEDKHRAAAVYVLTTVFFCVGAAWFGITAADRGWT